MERKSLLESEEIKTWLTQFQHSDQLLATELLERFLFVSRDEFSEGLRELVLTKAQGVQGPIALYAERELRHRGGVPHRLFKEQKRKIRRANGCVGPAPVKATKAYDPSVGSEGIISQLITELCRENPKKFYNHPGPDIFRKNKIRRIWVITDFVGSGARMHRYMEAAWIVRSVRSWWSGKFIRFGVLSYSSTSVGERLLMSHKCQPDIFYLHPCPTIDTKFNNQKARELKDLCKRYDPTVSNIAKAASRNGFDSLGYGGSGALIAFAHGAPNNTPLIFHKGSDKKNKWTPLFPARVTAGIPRKQFGSDYSAQMIAKRLESLGQKNLARSMASRDSPVEVRKRFLVLASLSRSPRIDVVLAFRSGLSTLDVSSICDELIELGWINSRRRLTDIGYRELEHVRKGSKNTFSKTSSLDKSHEKPYYPTALRPPVHSSR
ncbi:phosphoribosyltransferase-like protein [Aeromonas caviae]|uniref:phosphoribosyltransferase-like protein n=1 Tax=Aeromonas caviae TaxID=648 RepID=UPI0029D8DA8A|nr:hypothetical protein [Aeromonas caviae]MDX7718657.1 hypothetical protein [Aeromonas caviae]